MRLVLVLLVCLLLPGCATLTAGAIGGAIALGAASAVGSKSFSYHDYMARDYFDFLSKQDENQTVWRAPGSGSHVHRKGVFEHKARSAHLRTLEAINYDNHEWSRRKKWREVFGPLYPG